MEEFRFVDLIDALQDAPRDAPVDERIKGIGSWRGYYPNIAIFTNENGYRTQRWEFNQNQGFNDHAAREAEFEDWQKNSVVEADKLPNTAGELADLLHQLCISGQKFVGYKGGLFEIDYRSIIWLEECDGSYTREQIVGITETLELITENRWEYSSESESETELNAADLATAELDEDDEKK